MDIYIIEISCADKVSDETLKEFCKKDITNPNVYKAHTLAYLMVDRILKEVYKIEDREVIFVDKKPMLKNKQKYFSISHSGDYIALAFADSNCGVDIEKIKLREFATISERMGFEATTLGEFYQEWTQYEAISKLGLDSVCGSYANYELEGYALTAVSEDQFEEYELFSQVEE